MINIKRPVVSIIQTTAVIPSGCSDQDDIPSRFQELRGLHEVVLLKGAGSALRTAFSVSVFLVKSVHNANMEPTPQPAISPANSHAENLQIQQPTNAEKPSAQAASKYTVSSNVTVKSLSQPSSSPTRPSPSLPKPPSPWRIWRLEILFCIISLGSFISVIAVLRTYEGRSLPDLPMRVTLNTVVAFLTTLTKASFMTFLSESISQLKWNAFHTYPGRPLRDFDLMDRASRGVAGSFSLLRRLKWRQVGRNLDLKSTVLSMRPC